MAHPQFLQWSFQHAREIVPAARISRGNGSIAKLPEHSQPLADLPVTPLGAAVTTVGAVLATTYTDGFLVMHDGAVVAEEYPGGMGTDTLHLLMSVTKSMIGSVAAVLAERGQLDLVAQSPGSWSVTTLPGGPVEASSWKVGSGRERRRDV